jgi:acetyl-CoA carboxylase biotin carboxylase subunit
MFRKVLVANRGEIAVRVIRALREMRIASVAVYSDADRASLHVRMADEAAHIGASPAPESYLRSDRILDAARRLGAEAIHPGYGFLSENADFAAACEAGGIVFIGPPAEAIRRLGSKTEARKIASLVGAPVVPGTLDPVAGVEDARAIAARFGYPILLKAAAGGGGKGMRRVDSGRDLESAFRDASSEAERSFRNGEIYVEKLIDKPRHIEIQVLGDRHGNLIHLGERECSIQRRHQKVIEECPSPLVAAHPGMRRSMGETALRVARAAGYTNAGTVEFLVDADRNFYFLEMNTRLQVEHPITELVTGLDLVHWQLRLAAGEPLTLRQDQIDWRGAAMECRIYAEDPDNQFFPSPGLIRQLDRPSGPGIRLDSGVYAGWTVPLEYDPLLAKLAVWAETRDTAIERMLRALDEYYVSGIKTNLSLFRQLFAYDSFRAGLLHTAFIEEFFSKAKPAGAASPDADAVAGLAAVVHFLDQGPSVRDAGHSTACRWRADGRGRLMR